MLINFTVENFRSFGEEQTLNLVASKAQTGHEEHCVPLPSTDQSVLRTSVIYGANASGKSNLVKAIDFARDLIIQGAGPMKRIALNQFRFTSDSPKPSWFEFRFLVEDQLFVYGFELTSEEVTEERLSATNEDGKEAEVFYRSGETINIGEMKKFGADRETYRETLKALKLLGTRPNQLLLNKIADLEKDRKGKMLTRVVWWFNSCLAVIEPDSSFAQLIEYLDEKPDFREFASEFLASVGTGINSLGVDHSEIEAEKLPKQLIESLQSLNNVELTALPVGSGMSLNLDPENPTKVIRRNLASEHNVAQRNYSLPFEDESDGTQRLLHLIPALYHLKNRSKVFVIDELDRSLHPLLSHAVLKFFVETCPTAHQQLIVTTHETHLLDLDLLRRDEVWFVEKDSKQQSQLHSLADLKIRKDLRIEKSYLQGRFGGIPFIGHLDKLKDLIECSTAN